MAAAIIQINKSMTTQATSGSQVVFIGQPKNVSKLTFEKIQSKLNVKVTKDVFELALDTLTAAGGPETISLFLNKASIALLPQKCSRHNTPTQSHAVSRIVSKLTSGEDETFVIVCEKQDVFASACAVARSFPLYNKKSGDSTDDQKPQKTERTVTIEFFLVDGKQITDEDIVALRAAIESVRLTAKIVDAPCEEMDVDGFLNEISRIAAELEVTSEIIRGKDLVKKGLGGIWSVGKAAASLPALAVLSHTPQDATETVAWVGKGIVYDTGGLSLKPRVSMVGMKRDCGGAAAILGAFAAAIKCGFKQNLHAVFCLAENAIGPLATRPDDVVLMYSGKTVEVNNTDAEGRMVLSDGVAFATKDLGAKIVLDMATLTGAQGIATGKFHGAVITNSRRWEEASVIAGQLSGDLLFPLPYAPELHFKEFSSAIADMKNSVADRFNAQSSCAGLFIQSHIGFDFDGEWIHIDMAYPVHSGERATGYGVALLMAMFADYSSNSCIKALSPFNPEEGDKKRVKLD